MAGGIGYYMYRAGGDPKTAEKKFEGIVLLIFALAPITHRPLIPKPIFLSPALLNPPLYPINRKPHNPH